MLSSKLQCGEHIYIPRLSDRTDMKEFFSVSHETRAGCSVDWASDVFIYSARVTYTPVKFLWTELHCGTVRKRRGINFSLISSVGSRSHHTDSPLFMLHS